MIEKDVTFTIIWLKPFNKIIYPNRMNLKHKAASCLVMTAQFPVIMTPPSVYLIPFKENLS